MTKLTSRARKALPKRDFAVPSKAPGSGSYPIENASHARDALARSSGKPVAGEVRAAVARKFPGMGKGKAKRSGEAKHPGSHEEFERLGREDHGKY